MNLIIQKLHVKISQLQKESDTAEDKEALIKKRLRAAEVSVAALKQELHVVASEKQTLDRDLQWNRELLSAVRPKPSAPKKRPADDDTDCDSVDKRSRGSPKLTVLANAAATWCARCGKDNPGDGHSCKWKPGPDGSRLCNACGVKWNKDDKPEDLSLPYRDEAAE